jgi:prolipoprotein diacylglyceryl transferase
MWIWDVDPVLIRIGFVQIRYYGLLFAIAFLIGLFLLRRFLRLKGQDPLMADSILTYLVFGIVIGARLIHVMFYDTEYYLSNPSEILKIWHGGVASHGAVLGSFAALFIFCKRHKQDFWDITDSVAIQFILVTGLVRLGNFFNSEIVGRITDVPWAVKFPRHDHALPLDQVHWRHPSQLYEFSYHIIGYFLIKYLYLKFYPKLKSGTIIFVTVSYYAFCRFLVEFVKEYQTEISRTGLTMGQWLSLPFLVFGILLLFWRQKVGAEIKLIK